MIKILCLILAFLLVITPSMAITINQTCLDNTTLQIIDGKVNESCNFGCDNTTNTCNPSPSGQAIGILVLIIMLCIGGAWLINWARRK